MGGVKKTFVYLTISRHPNFGPLFLAFRGKKALKEIKVRKRYDAAGFFTSRGRPKRFVTKCHLGGGHEPVADLLLDLDDAPLLWSI